MIFNGRIKELTTCDVSKIVAELPAFDSPLWYAYTKRQEDNRVHEETLNIVIKRLEGYSNGVFNPVDLYDGYPTALVEAVHEVANKVGELLNGTVTNAVLIMLPPGKKIHIHKDISPLTLVHRCHIPVVTNDQSNFTLLGVDFNLQKGIIYEVNNQLLHKAENNGITPRIHLLVDVLPNAQ